VIDVENRENSLSLLAKSLSDNDKSVTSSMPRNRPIHLQREVSRHNKPVWYHRIGKGPRTRLHGTYGTPEFLEEYRAAENGERPSEAQKPVKQSGSLAWAAALYQDSAAWRKLSEATRRQRANILKRVVAENGTVLLKQITKKGIIASYEKRSKTPAAARNFLETMRGFFKWAVKADLRKDNPTEGVEAVRTGGGPGFPIWTEEDVEKYEARWPVGTRPRVALDVIRYTGLRRGDACRLGRPHVKEGIARIATEKSGFTIWVALRLPQELLATIAAGPCGELTFIAREDGKPYTKESFGNMFKEWCRAAGINKSAHGLRKVRATKRAEDGATNLQLDAEMGWILGSGTSKLYIEKANRERLSLQGGDGEVTELRKTK
jgi:integrase